MLLLTKEIEGLNSGISIMEEILSHVLKDYISRKDYDEFIKIHQFKAVNC